MNENRRETFFIAFSEEHECEIKSILLLFTIFFYVVLKIPKERNVEVKSYQ